MKKSTFEQMGGTYRQEGDYLLPNPVPESAPVGIWGQRHRRYLREQAFFFCSAYRGSSDECSAHFIQEKVVEELVLEGLQRLLWYIQVYEKRFAQEQMERFATLSVSLETEQKQLKAAIPEMEASLDATTDKAADLQRFLERARQVTWLAELTPEIAHEFIEKVVVSKPDTVDGKRHQWVDIHYNTIGLWCAPSPEEVEKLFQGYLAGQRKKTV